MSDFQLCLIREVNNPAIECVLPACWRGFWLASGQICLDEHVLRAGDGRLHSGPVRVAGDISAGADWLRFELIRADADPMLMPSSRLLSRQMISLTEPEVLLRLDQVTFPPGAVAYRHVHPGPGIRFLAAGQLEIIADHHVEQATPGHAWFEAANSPVKAVAHSSAPETSFIRFMVLPVKFAGLPSINILDNADAQKPRRQITQRFFDQPIRLI